MSADARTLLVVDDEPSVLHGLAVLFGRRGYRVLVASTGVEAICILRERRVDGLLVDFRIPDLRGDVLFEAAKALQPWLADRTIFLSGDIGGDVAEAVRGTRCLLLLKPFELDALERAVGAMLDDASSADEASG